MAFEPYGNGATANLEPVLLRNVMGSEYWRRTVAQLESVEVRGKEEEGGETGAAQPHALAGKQPSHQPSPSPTFHPQAVIDQIYYDVTDVEPWLSSTARGPSSAFVLLYRLHTLKPTLHHIRTLLTHTDSPYIRAVGFLYLRYAANPRSLWGWCERYVEDPEEFAPSPGGRTVTIGAFVLDLLLSHFYFETLFPRMPKPVADEVEARLRERGLPTRAAGNGGAGGAGRRGGGGGGDGRPPSVKASLSVAFGQRAPNRAGAPRDDHRSRGGGSGGGSNRWRDERRRSRSPPRRRSRSRSRERGDYGRRGGDEGWRRDGDRRWEDDRRREGDHRRDDYTHRR